MFYPIMADEQSKVFPTTKALKALHNHNPIPLLVTFSNLTPVPSSNFLKSCSEIDKVQHLS